MFLANTSSPLYFLPFRTNESLSLQITCDHRFKLTLLGFCEWGFLINSTVPFYFKLLWFLLPYMLSCFTAFVQKLFDYLIFKKNLSKIEIWYNDHRELKKLWCVTWIYERQCFLVVRSTAFPIRIIPRAKPGQEVPTGFEILCFIAALQV